MSQSAIHSNQAPEPVGAYPHAKRVGDFLFLSGIGPRTRNSSDIPGVTLDDANEIVEYDIATQTHSVFNNIKLILADANAHWSNLIDITVFLTNIKADFPIFNSIYSQYFQENQPCRTTVEVNALPTPIAIELKCIALVSS